MSRKVVEEMWAEGEENLSGPRQTRSNKSISQSKIEISHHDGRGTPWNPRCPFQSCYFFKNNPPIGLAGVEAIGREKEVTEVNTGGENRKKKNGPKKRN
jgi:hypothetical protein